MRWVFERRISYVKFKMHHNSCLRATKYQYSHKKWCFTGLIVGGHAVTTISQVIGILHQKLLHQNIMHPSHLLRKIFGMKWCQNMIFKQIPNGTPMLSSTFIFFSFEIQFSWRLRPLQI